MVCVSCNVNTPAARLLPGYLHPPPFCGGARLSLHELICRPGGLPALEPPRRRRGRRHALHLCCDVSATGPNAAPANFNPPQPPQQLWHRQQLRSSLFPGGFRRPEIRVPTVVLRVDAADVLRSKDAIDEAVSGGFVGIVLLRGGDDSGGQLYEAACVLRSVVRDRAHFLIAERVDVAAAVGATGVVLSDQGLPVIVARNMLMNSKADSVLLPIVARDVQSAFSAMTGAASEGADFLIFGIDKKNYAKILEGSIMMQKVKVPIFVNIIDCFGEDSPSDVMPSLLRSDASGLVLSLDDVKMLSYDMSSIFSPAQAPDMRMQNESQCSHNYNAEDDPQEKSLVAGFSKLDDKEIKLIEAERSILLVAIAVIRKAAPLMREVSLLEDAVARLDQPFMMVIVGEFNSGKSTVINALLGRRYLAEGVVPTTNEITLLSYSEMEESERCETHPDGQFICYLPAPILKEINLVDTPGTNVILQRQQRLTEEFVPRADLVVFVLSSDRPLTESEVAFLLYMEQWKKKVIFVLNKSDLYRDTSELEEAVMFVKENARRLLNKEDVTIYPVSARSALEAKLSVSSDTGRDSENLLLHDSRWVTSGFYELENFLFSFLDGSTDTGMERMKLKLDTPIGIAERLLSSCETEVKHEYHCATKDLASINDLISSVNDCAMRMENESMSWMKRTVSLVETAKNRATELIESTLQLSNIELITTYAVKGERSGSLRTTSAIQNEIISPALSEAQTVVRDYLLWLQSNAIREKQHYLNSFEKRWSGFFSVGNPPCSESFDLMAKGEELSIKVTDDFSSSAAAKLFEQEIREVVLGTFGALGVAGLSASLLTSVLPTTLEDLLALTFCSAGGLLAISNFPTRRKETVEKVRKVADSFACELEAAMQEDLARTIESLRQSVAIISKPYQEGAQHRINRLLSIQEELTNVEQRLQSIKVEIQNLHVS